MSFTTPTTPAAPSLWPAAAASSSSQQQQPAVVYSVPHANRNVNSNGGYEQPTSNYDDAGSAEPSTSSSSQQQQPAVVYLVPHANRKAGTGPGAANEAGGYLVDDFVSDGGIGNPVIYATYDAGAGAGAGAADTMYAGYEPPSVALGGATAPNIIYSVPLEDDGRWVVPRVPNSLHPPAANNANDADGRSNSNRNTATAAASTTTALLRWRRQLLRCGLRSKHRVLIMQSICTHPNRATSRREDWGRTSGIVKQCSTYHNY